ncbi:MAG TPA: hypothetical protein DGG94_09735, partial [Micromonosporaceae bacterium]|nr:hypothetical protein [Micromonosporaceae bacterium]HCU50064.1 hypothetical protein [Micromonosporaceae bacterium]
MPSIAKGAALMLLAGALTGIASSAEAEPVPVEASAVCSVLFDDFHYASSTDPLLRARNWTVRTNAGGPGVPGASWPASNITFPTAEGQRVMQLSASTDGSNSGTSQSEILHQRKFFEGTYASRVRFTDAPTTGADGDHMVETFFTITPLNYPMDPSYGEIDFEYLPNGGWGETGPTFFETTWETYQPDPWIADNVHSLQRRSYAGWHDLVAQVKNGRVKYYIDGTLVADHGDKFYPETPMSINYNLWFIDLAGHSGGRSTYIQQVDWLYFADGEVITTDDARNRVASYRAAGTTHVDTVGTPGTCPDPGGRPLIGLANKCADVRAANSANGTPIQIYDCNGTPAQQWTVVGNTLRAFGKCMDIYNGGTANGSRIILWPCHGGLNQVWQLRSDQTVYNPRSGRCLDVPNNNSTNGTQLEGVSR